MKRYQIALIFFSLGIALVTFSFDWFLSFNDKVTTTTTTVSDSGPEYSSLNIFFSNTNQDPNGLYCDKTYPIVRKISRPTNNPASRLGEFAYVAIKELLKGPTDAEKKEGFLTSINPETKVQKISIVDGVATVDFNQGLGREVGGSCRVGAIRSQITETLKQFPEIKDVVISINGETETILQP